MKLATLATAIAMIAAAPALSQSADAQSQSYSSSGIRTHGDTVYSSSVVAPSSNNTAPCVIAPSGGIGALGAGVAGSSPYIGKDCITERESLVLRSIARLKWDDPVRVATIQHYCSNIESMRRTMVSLGWCRIPAEQ